MFGLTEFLKFLKDKIIIIPKEPLLAQMKFLRKRLASKTIFGVLTVRPFFILALFVFIFKITFLLKINWF